MQLNAQHVLPDHQRQPERRREGHQHRADDDQRCHQTAQQEQDHGEDHRQAADHDQFFVAVEHHPHIADQRRRARDLDHAALQPGALEGVLHLACQIPDPLDALVAVAAAASDDDHAGGGAILGEHHLQVRLESRVREHLCGKVEVVSGAGAASAQVLHQ
ncbi:Uncharacterised protein [Mycobacteroides abscessus subsp. massiliense]|nr:Uncharacterised protein [Mycobacteroides abscessus subsp. massiliense]